MRGRPPDADRGAGNHPRRTRHTAGLADGKKVGTISKAELHAAMLRTFADGIGNGIAVTVLDGLQAHRGIASLTVVNQRQSRLHHLQSEAAKARDLAKRARTNATEEPDPDVRADYMSDARRYTAHARSCDDEHARLLTLTEGTALPETFDGEVDYLLCGLRALLVTPDGRVSDDQANALRTVLRDFVVEPDGRQARWSARLLVPADGRVLALGPFTGTVPLKGRTLTGAERDDLANAQGSALRRRHIIHQLEEQGLPRHLARAASLAPQGLLPRVLLGEDVRWPNCHETFDHDRFNAHLRNLWCASPAPGWAASVYCQTNPRRQALADFVAALGGRASLTQTDALLTPFGMRRNDIYSITLPKVAHNPHTPPWPPTVHREGEWSAGNGAEHSHLASPRCPHCGEPATAVVRVLEVTDALLCRNCLIMPSDPTLEFPALYRDLSLPTTDFDDDLLATARAAAPARPADRAP